MTVEEFWAFCHRPENKGRILELLRGEVVELPIPYSKHGVVCARVGFLIEEYARRSGRGYTLLGCVGIILPREPQSVLGPDVSYFSAATADDEHPTGWVATLPTLAVEVVSPADAPAVTIAKIQEYIANGVKLVWQIDYEARTVTIFRPDKTMEVVKEDGELTGGDELPGFSCKVGDFFRLPGDQPAAPPQPPLPPTAP